MWRGKTAALVAGLLAGSAGAEEPPAAIKLEVKQRAYTQASTIGTGGPVLVYTGGTSVSEVRMWATDERGRPIGSESFARWTGAPEADEIAAALARRRSTTRLALGLGAAGWVVGGALLLSAREADTPPALGIVSVVGGQALVVTGIVLRVKYRARSQRLEFWFSEEEARQYSARYNQSRGAE